MKPEILDLSRLESHLWEAANILRGPVDAADFKTYVFPLLFFKRISDVHDEEYRTALEESKGDVDYAKSPEHYRFQIPKKCHWRYVREVASNVGQALQEAMRAIETANPDKLFGIFGDAQWTNKERLSDAMLRDLVEHFSTLELTLANLPEDELGNGYEYLIKKFADDSGHTAAEFYTNRTVVHLMTEMLEPQPGESIYDPTCGSGGMLLSSIAHLRSKRKEWRNVRLYGQERNLMTSSIARMNCFLHGIEDFRIERGDTLSEPKLVKGDRLMRFDVVLANPPYSIKQWDRSAWASDPWGRNLYGTPPQGRADYAFWQHIIKSMDPKTGRCAILFPHGVLFRQEEADMRNKLMEADLIEAVLGLGPNLFYNSPMEACVVYCRMAKPKAQRNKILFINAVNDVTRERGQSFLTEAHIARIVKAYRKPKDEPGFSRLVPLEEIRKQNGNLSIPMYISAVSASTNKSGEAAPDLAAALTLLAGQFPAGPGILAGASVGNRIGKGRWWITWFRRNFYVPDHSTPPFLKAPRRRIYPRKKSAPLSGWPAPGAGFRFHPKFRWKRRWSISISSARANPPIPLCFSSARLLNGFSFLPKSSAPISMGRKRSSLSPPIRFTKARPLSWWTRPLISCFPKSTWRWEPGRRVTRHR